MHQAQRRVLVTSMHGLIKEWAASIGQKLEMWLVSRIRICGCSPPAAFLQSAARGPSSNIIQRVVAAVNNRLTGRSVSVLLLKRVDSGVLQ